MTGHNGEPHLTVITAVLNGADHIENTILSVLKPHPVPIVFLVIDGNSDDGTQKILERYSDSINFWSSEPDRGIYDAMNKGWALADSTSIVLFLGAGDQLISLPGKDDLIQADTVIYGTVQVSERECFIPHCNWRLRFYNSLHHQGLLIPKYLNPEPPFDCRFPKYADFDFNQRLYRRGVKFRYHPSLKTYALPDGLTASFSLRESLSVIIKNFGPGQAGLSLMAYTALRIFPSLRRYRPYSEIMDL